MPPVGSEPTISVGERPQTYASDRVATGNGHITLVKEPEYPLNRMLGGPQSRSGPSGEKKKKKHLVPARDSTPHLPASSLVTILTTLCRIPYVMAAQRHRV